MSSFIFIGSIQCGSPGTGGGVQNKNQYFISYIKDRYPDCKIIDTWGMNSFVALIKIIIIILQTNRKTPIVLSISKLGPYCIAKLFHFFGLKRRCFYWVAGGNLAIFLKKKSKSTIRSYGFYEKVVVQCDYLKRDLEELGIKNCLVVPNFKPIDYLPIIKNNDEEQKRFVFLSRILKEKGIDEIVEAVKRLNNPLVSVDLYGSLCAPYSVEYFTGLKDLNISYKGFMDMRQNESYDILSKYYALLLPTYYMGEGFPGTLIDAQIAALPSIVSDFHANPEVIKNYYNGIIIPPKDSQSLANAMNSLINDRSLRDELSHNARMSVNNYDVDYVLGKALRDLNLSDRD